MTGAYNVAMQENKTKKRQAVDQSVGKEAMFQFTLTCI